MLRRSMVPTKLMVEASGGSKGGCFAGPLYQTVRYNHLKNHAHLTYSNIGTHKKRIPIVDPKLLKFGEPVTPTLMLGDMVKAREFQFDVESLNARGFLRFQKPYTPPPDVVEKVLQTCRTCLNVEGDEQTLISTQLDDPRLKYELLTKLLAQFQHEVPNSMLHMMCTVGNLVAFYNTRVNTQTPFEELVRNKELPPNLHIQKEPLRFHPDTDNLFKGETAFTKSSTIVTGLRAKKKYRGYEAKMTWP